MIEFNQLPALNASLNAITAGLLFSGFIFIRNKRVAAHRACMLGAVFVSAIFLGCYLYYHFYHGVTRFTTPGWPKMIYFTILITHTILAITILPLIGVALYFAFRRRFDSHKRVTRWLWPMWMYVSITGVIVYFMLYRWFPPIG
jgi:putative membrane protein